MSWFDSNTLRSKVSENTAYMLCKFDVHWEINHLLDSGYREGKLDNTAKFY